MGFCQKGFDCMWKESLNVECIETTRAFSLRGGRIVSCRGGRSPLRRRASSPVRGLSFPCTGK